MRRGTNGERRDERCAAFAPVMSDDDVRTTPLLGDGRAEQLDIALEQIDADATTHAVGSESQHGHHHLAR